MSTQAIAVDLGGTWIRFARIAGDTSAVLTPEVVIPTPRGREELMAALKREVGELRGEAGLVVVATAGLVKNGEVIAAVNLPTPLQIESYLSTARREVCVINDAQAQAFGLVSGEENLILLTIGTGVGGAVCVGGQLVTGDHGYAGELGHIRATEDQIPCSCGDKGCLDVIASGKALEGALGLEWWKPSQSVDPGLLRRQLSQAGGATARVLLGVSRALDIRRVAISGRVTTNEEWRTGYSNQNTNTLFPAPKPEFYSHPSTLVFRGLARLVQSPDLAGS